MEGLEGTLLWTAIIYGVSSMIAGELNRPRWKDLQRPQRKTEQEGPPCA